MGSGDDLDVFRYLLEQMKRDTYARQQASSLTNASTTSTMSAAARKRNSFNQGDMVVLTELGPYDFNDSNPQWGRDGLYIRGIVTNLNYDGVRVQWENGRSNSYDFSYGNLLTLWNDVKDQKKGKMFGSKVVLDTSKLDPWVIEADKKAQVIAVLKQHHNAAKLFDEWGLGEVIEYGRGMTMMFYGGPGTGKTWGASCIAKALGLDVLIISAAEIQSSEPGGANRNIKEAFDDAKKKHKILFIDECDSLITSRNDVGMILGSEINTLLTEIEKFEGVCILATNRIDTMDEALERRISLILEFPNPNFTQREEIWRKMLPKKMPLGKDVKTKKLAEYALTGGQIKNAVLQAARTALSNEKDSVGLEDFDLAINNIINSKNLMGSRSRYNQRIVDEVGLGMSRSKTAESEAATS